MLNINKTDKISLGGESYVTSINLNLRPIDEEGDVILTSYNYKNPTNRFRVVHLNILDDNSQDDTYSSILLERKSFTREGGMNLTPEGEVEIMIFADEIRSMFGADEMEFVEDNGGWLLDLYCYNSQELSHLNFIDI